jgi:aminomethyltransferase
VDDVVLFERDAESFLMIVNAGNIDRDIGWLREQDPIDCGIKDVSGELSLLALQGPRAQEILQQVTGIDLPSVAFYHFSRGHVAERAATVSRTGYTGEDGFEIMIANADAEPVWRRLLAVGEEHGLVPVGLGARDTLRLEAKFCLYGTDINETTTLFEGGLGWLVCLDEAKGDFIGRPVLERQKREGVSRRLVGFEMVGRGIARQGYPLYVGGSEVGQVTSGTYAPYLKKNIGLGYLPIAHSTVGCEFEVGIRDRRVAAQVVKTPFYKRPR